MEEKKFAKSNDKVIFGVCSGIAKYFGVDKTIVRLVWALSTVFFGVGPLAYLICALVMPRESEN